MRILPVIIALIVLASCQKDPENPYEDLQSVVVDNPDVDDLPEGNFAWLHGKVFLPTCANSGCHDGTFEPEFLTISSAYNSLVNHDVIANDAAFSFDYRVVPGNVNASFLHERLTNSIPNTSGVMPLSLEPESDWESLQDFYIGQIENWISAGAPDMFGQLPGEAGADLPPQVDGIVIFPSGNSTDAYLRDPESAGITPILVEAAPIDLWFRALDDNTPASDLTTTEMRYGEDLGTFESTSIPAPLVFTGPISAPNLNDVESDYQFRASIDLSGVASGTTYFIRTYWNDGAQSGTTEIPNEGSSDVVTLIFTMQVQ